MSEKEEKEVEEVLKPMEVIVKNQPKKENDYHEDEELDDLFISGEEIEEFEKDGS